MRHPVSADLSARAGLAVVDRMRQVAGVNRRPDPRAELSGSGLQCFAPHDGRARCAKVWVALGLLSLGGCATLDEPRNLDAHKHELRAYVETGAYARGLERSAAEATRWIEQRVARRSDGEQLAIVMDLDETLLLNWARIDASDFTYVRADWDRWVAEASAPAIQPMLDLFHLARSNNVEVFFITGRPERHRRDTERNLQRIGCDGYEGLSCAPDDWKGTAAEFKMARRRQIVGEGRTIIANIGDQASDLVGGFAERTFKVPNPFYLSK